MPAPPSSPPRDHLPPATATPTPDSSPIALYTPSSAYASSSPPHPASASDPFVSPEMAARVAARLAAAETTPTTRVPESPAGGLGSSPPSTSPATAAAARDPFASPPEGAEQPLTAPTPRNNASPSPPEEGGGAPFAEVRVALLVAGVGGGGLAVRVPGEAVRALVARARGGGGLVCVPLVVGAVAGVGSSPPYSPPGAESSPYSPPGADEVELPPAGSKRAAGDGDGDGGGAKRRRRG